MSDVNSSTPGDVASPQDAPSASRWSEGSDASAVTWVERDGRFVEVECGGHSYALDGLDGEQLTLKIPAETCGNGACSQRFPSNFSHCPDCGTALRPAFSSPGGLWSYPGPDGDGLLNTERVDIVKVSAPSSEAYPPPEAPNLTLVVAGTPRRLLAIDREHSRVFAFARDSRTWRSLNSEIEFDLNLRKWSWAVPAFDGGIALVTECGPALVNLNALGSGLVVKTPPEAGRCLAGPGMFDDRILFLCDKDGAPSVVGFDMRAQTWSAPEPVKNAPSIHDGDTFAAPAAPKASQTLFWVGRRGYISVRALPGKLDVIWRDWPNGFEPELQLRPIWTANSLWQFGAAAGQLQFVKIALRGEQIANNVEATHLTAGECSYTSGMRVYSTPWDEEHAQNVGSGDSFYMPVCGLYGVSAVVADCGFDINNRRVNPDELLQDNAQRRPAKLRIHRRVSAPVELQRSPSISSLQQLQAVVFDGNLLIYNSGNNTIDSWAILESKDGRG